MSGSSRAEFLSRGARGGLALAAGGGLLAVATAPARGGEGGSGDAGIATLAATAELLAIDFYTRAIEGGAFSGPELAYLEAARENERDHYAALADVLGDAAPSGLTFSYPTGAFAGRTGIAATGAALEQAFVGAYMGAVAALRSDELRGVAALVGANEAQHLTTLRRIEAGAFAPSPSMPAVLSPAEATTALAPFSA